MKRPLDPSQLDLFSDPAPAPKACPKKPLCKTAAQAARPVAVPEEPPATLPERFAEFHASNPHVYGHLRTLALGLRRRGHESGGIAQLFEVLRWQQAMQTVGDDFKLNNDYRAFYARMLMSEEPELAGFFEIRSSAAGGAPTVDAVSPTK